MEEMFIEKKENEEAQTTQETQENKTQEQEVTEEVKKEETKEVVKEVKKEEPKKEKKEITPEEDLLHSRISILAHSIAAFVMGYVSLIMHKTMSGWIVVPIGFIVLILLGFVVEWFVGKRGFKWWAANGLFIYLFFWAVAWTVFFNLGF
ncbi:MAG: hypothetical protein KJ613_04030 [Nanoarchaeota archaeon]|nr:hypothetical protein [Nanoarchaeota archaeon]